MKGLPTFHFGCDDRLKIAHVKAGDQLVFEDHRCEHNSRHTGQKLKFAMKRFDLLRTRNIHLPNTTNKQLIIYFFIPMFAAKL